MSRFFVDEKAINKNNIFITDKNDIKHITKVLRMEEGFILNISDTGKYEYKCEIIHIEKERITCKILHKQPFSRESKVLVTIYQGIPKHGKMENIIQKCVELGIYKVVPVFTARSVVVDNNGRMHSKVQRWQKISNEAVKQCDRGIQPKICEALDFKEVIGILKGKVERGDLVLFPYENETNTTIKDVLRGWKTEINEPAKVSFIIGPEGGFSESEAELIKILGAKSISLGKSILRTETAGMATLAMIMYELEL